MAGMVIDGIAASEAIDSSGEILDIKGCDISDLEKGVGVLNYEHRGDDAPGASPGDVVGKIIFAKKIFKREDAETDRQRKYWDFVKLPYIYIKARLYDGDERHVGARAAAAMIRDHHDNNEPILARFSIEGSTLKKEGNRLVRSIARKVALTLKPCNKSAISGLVSDPNGATPITEEKSESAKDLLAGLVEVSKKEVPGSQPLGGSFEIEIDPLITDDTVSMLRQSALKLRELAKTYAAGVSDGAPSTLTGYAALQREDLGGERIRLRNHIKAALRDYDPVVHKNLSDFIKNYPGLTEASPQFIEHFKRLMDDVKLGRMKKNLRTIEWASLELKRASRLIKEEEPPRRQFGQPRAEAQAAPEQQNNPPQQEEPKTVKEIEPIDFRGQLIKPGKARVVKQNGADLANHIPYVVLYHNPDAQKLYVVPEAEFKNGQWDPDKMERWKMADMNDAFLVDLMPEKVKLQKGLIDPDKHALPEFLADPDQAELMRGIDIDSPIGKPAHFRGGITSGGWYSSRSGKTTAYVKNDGNQGPSGMSASRAETLYHNLARFFLGLKKFVPTTAIFRNPNDNKIVHAIEAIKNPRHFGNSQKDYDTIRKHLDRGDLDKMYLMNKMFGNTDRHGNNYMFGTNEDGEDQLYLIDHGYTFPSSPMSAMTPHYFSSLMSKMINGGEIENSHELGVHPDTFTWLKNIDLDKMSAYMDKHGAPKAVRDTVLKRVKNMKEYAEKEPKTGLVELFHSADRGHSFQEALQWREAHDPVLMERKKKERLEAQRLKDVEAARVGVRDRVLANLAAQYEQQPDVNPADIVDRLSIEPERIADIFGLKVENPDDLKPELHKFFQHAIPQKLHEIQLHRQAVRQQFIAQLVDEYGGEEIPQRGGVPNILPFKEDLAPGQNKTRAWDVDPEDKNDALAALGIKLGIPRKEGEGRAAHRARLEEALKDDLNQYHLERQWSIAEQENRNREALKRTQLKDAFYKSVIQEALHSGAWKLGLSRDHQDRDVRDKLREIIKKHLKRHVPRDLRHLANYWSIGKHIDAIPDDVGDAIADKMIDKARLVDKMDSKINQANAPLVAQMQNLAIDKATEDLHKEYNIPRAPSGIGANEARINDIKALGFPVPELPTKQDRLNFVNKFFLEHPNFAKAIEAARVHVQNNHMAAGTRDMQNLAYTLAAKDVGIAQHQPVGNMMVRALPENPDDIEKAFPYARLALGLKRPLREVQDWQDRVRGMQVYGEYKKRHEKQLEQEKINKLKEELKARDPELVRTWNWNAQKIVDEVAHRISPYVDFLKTNEPMPFSDSQVLNAMPERYKALMAHGYVSPQQMAGYIRNHIAHENKEVKDQFMELAERIVKKRQFLAPHLKDADPASHTWITTNKLLERMGLAPYNPKLESAENAWTRVEHAIEAHPAFPEIKAQIQKEMAEEAVARHQRQEVQDQNRMLSAKARIDAIRAKAAEKRGVAAERIGRKGKIRKRKRIDERPTAERTASGQVSIPFVKPVKKPRKKKEAAPAPDIAAENVAPREFETWPGEGGNQ